MQPSTQIRPKKAYVIENVQPSGTHSAIENFDPELPKDLWWGGVAYHEFKGPEEEAQALIRASRLMLNTSEFVDGDRVAPVLRMDSNYFISSEIKAFFDAVEPGVHRYFEARVASRVPVGGKTEHGTYFWLRLPPIVDCLLFPQTKTIADVQGATWDKTPEYNSIGLPFMWGGGVAFSRPAYIEGAKIEGHHFWLTRQGPGVRQLHLMTWSHVLYQEYQRRQLEGWRVQHELNIVY